MNGPLVAVGIGNTTIKFGVADRIDPAGVVWSNQLEIETATFDPARLADQLPGDGAAWRVASVHRPSETRLAEWVQAHHNHADYRRLAADDLPLRVGVEHPQRVGLDRLVAAVAANHLRQPACPAVVIDAGTAITVDGISHQGVFLGGAILPGLRLASRALAAHTDLLPEVPVRFAKPPPDPLGKSTEAAIASGLFWGAAGAVRELVRRMRPQLAVGTDQPPQLFVTGGDAAQLVPWIDADAQFVDDLVLMGIALASRPQ